MNAFFTSILHVLEIEFCMRVTPDDTGIIHKNRPSHGLVYLLDGESCYRFSDGCVLYMRKGDVFYLPKGSSYTVDKMKAPSCIAVNFQIAEDASFAPFLLKGNHAAKYDALFHAILSAWETQTPTSYNICFAKLYEVICAIQRDTAEAYISPRARTLAENGACLMQSKLHDTALTVQNIANTLDVTPEYFRRVFSAYYGVSPKNYLFSLRMEKAKALLSTQNLPLSEICVQCGYENESYFCKEFKRATQKTPREYGRMLRTI